MCINKANDEGVYTKRCRRHFLYLSFTSVSNYSLAVIRNKYHTHFLGSVFTEHCPPPLKRAGYETVTPSF